MGSNDSADDAAAAIGDLSGSTAESVVGSAVGSVGQSLGLGHLDPIRVDHVGIAVADLDEAIARYVGVLGLRCVHRETNADQKVHEAMLAVGPTEHPTLIQLLAPVTADSVIAKFLNRAGPGLHHVAYAVPDIAAATRELQGRGLRLVYAEPHRGTAGSSVNFIHPKEMGGVLVELVQPQDP